MPLSKDILGAWFQTLLGKSIPRTDRRGGRVGHCSHMTVVSRIADLRDLFVMSPTLLLAVLGLQTENWEAGTLVAGD